MAVRFSRRFPCRSIWTAGDFACSRPVRREPFKRQQNPAISSASGGTCPLLRHGATAAGCRSVSARATRRLPRPPRCASASTSLRQYSYRRRFKPGPLRAPLLPRPGASLAACEREGACRCQRRRAEGVPVRGARRVAVGGAQGDQARVPAPRAQVPPGREQGGACGDRPSAACSRSLPFAFLLDLYGISWNVGDGWLCSPPALWMLSMQPDAQEKFLRIKHAYNTLMNSESRSKYASSRSDSSWSSSSRENKSAAAEEPFYGFGT